MGVVTAKKVLIIEDSLTFANMISSSITNKYGFHVDVVGNYADARNLIEKQGDQYFVAIVDIDLPDAHKGEAVDLTVDAEIPTLVFSGTTGGGDHQDFWSKGIADYVSKQGTYGLEYVIWMTNRIFNNPNVKVLIVDDDVVIRTSTEFILKLHCYDVICASSGEEALSILKESPDIQICLMDCYMDGITGIETAARMRLTHSRDELEIIGVSAQNKKSLSVQFIKSGASDFLLKPFLPEEILCRVNHAAERLETYVKLKELNELKNQMLGTAAHDIRGPIAAIKTAMELINRGKVSETQKESLLKMIQNNSNDTLELLESLLDVSAIESGNINLNIEDTDLSALVRERIEIYEGQANNKSISLNGDIEQGISKPVDRIKIKEVVDNLVTNAIKFSPLESKVDILLNKEDKKIQLTVSDSGLGVPDDEQEKLFMPFSTLSSKSTGGEKQTGLGLAIVKNIVDAHEGHIFYRNQDKGGASFCVELPL